MHHSCNASVRVCVECAWDKGACVRGGAERARAIRSPCICDACKADV